jgi:F-type H+-transporting ATPase subunit epsilon
MAGTLQFDLVSPERRLASLVASEVMIPGADGDMTAMEGHAPTITALRTGTLRVVGAQGVKSYIVTGGFAEITSAAVSVLAERAIPFEEATGTVLDAILAEARSLAAAALPQDRDLAEKNVADCVALRDAVLAGHH